jgi:hypothetical protein
LTTLLSNVIFQGVISGIIASAIFLSVLFSLKPWILISDLIAEHVVEIRGDVYTTWSFKVINKSIFFKLFDVTVNVYVCTEVVNVNGTNIHRQPIHLLGSGTRTMKRLNFMHIGQNIFRGNSFLKSSTEYAAIFSTKNDLSCEINNHNSYIECQVLAKHSLTGFSKLKTREYKHQSKVKKGEFLSGNTCKIGEWNNGKTIIA